MSPELRRLIEIGLKSKRPANSENWQALFQLAERHKLQARLARSILNHDLSHLPTEVRENCERIRQNQLVAAASRLALAVKVRDVLSAADVSPQILKGPASDRFYKSAGVRDVGDLDIKVPPHLAARAISALLDEGFVAASPASPNCWKSHIRRYKDLTLQYHSSIVELHWRYTDSGRLLPNRFESELDETQQVQLCSGQEFQILAPMAEFVYLSIHGAIHQWARLHWLADIAPALENLSSTERCHLLDWSQTKGLHSTILLGAALWWNLTEEAPPEEFTEHIANDVRLQSMLDHCLRAITSGKPAWEQPDGIRMQRLRFSLGLKQSWRYRLEFLARRGLSRNF